MISDLVTTPWHWSISGLVIALVMYLLLREGGQFGVSSNLRTLCSLGGADRMSDFFDFDTDGAKWNLVFILGATVGGALSWAFLMSGDPMTISPDTIARLQDVGIQSGSEASGWLPPVFEKPDLSTAVLMLFGGVLVGFGSRYAGGCTSGHAISGLANLQKYSLFAVIGFFAGGLFSTWVLLPALF